MRLRSRYSLRTLLIVVTLAAIASWAYWIGLPWWLTHGRQSRFADAVRQLKVGMPIGKAQVLVDFEGERGWRYGLPIGESSEGNLIFQFCQSKAPYCIYWVQAKQDFQGRPHDPPMSQIELYDCRHCLPPTVRRFCRQATILFWAICLIS